MGISCKKKNHIVFWNIHREMDLVFINPIRYPMFTNDQQFIFLQ